MTPIAKDENIAEDVTFPTTLYSEIEMSFPPQQARLIFNNSLFALPVCTLEYNTV